MAWADSEASELYDTILFCARHGWSDSSYLLNAALGFLPNDLLGALWRDLAEPPVIGHAPEMLAIVIREGFTESSSCEPPAPPSVQPDMRMEATELEAAQYLLDHPDASIGAVQRRFKLARGTARYWRSGHKEIQRYIVHHLRMRIDTALERKRKSITSRLAQHLSEPPDIETRAEFRQVAEYVARHPGWTFDEVEEATEVPGFLLRAWTRMPQFEAAAMALEVAQQQPAVAES
jgi:hypothetical protein